MCGAVQSTHHGKKTFGPVGHKEGAGRAQNLRSPCRAWTTAGVMDDTPGVWCGYRTTGTPNQNAKREEKGTNVDSFKRARGSNGGQERSWLADPRIMI